MKIILVFALISLTIAQNITENEDSFDDWYQFQLKYNKTYVSITHEYHRRQIYQQNLQYIKKHNQEAAQGRYSYQLSMNHLGDLTDAEYQNLLLSDILSPAVSAPSWNQNSISSTTTSATTTKTTSTLTLLGGLPGAIDWRNATLLNRTSGVNFVTPIKNQGPCGACWAFAATAALESQYFRKTGKLVALSEQNLLDCSRGSYGNYGCIGGWMGFAYAYILKNRGIATSVTYPYINSTSIQSCKYNSAKSNITLSTYVNLPSGNEYRLTKAIAEIGPVACSIDGSDKNFRFYSSGIYNGVQNTSTPCSPYNLNHAVTLIGYGGTGNGAFYIGKNSWGVGWGQNGFFQIARSLTNAPNMCGIATASIYPLV